MPVPNHQSIMLPLLCLAGVYAIKKIDSDYFDGE